MSTKVTVVTNTASSNYTLTNGGETTGKFTLTQSARGPAGITQITSETAPTDTTVIWLDPSTGMYAIYIGGGWVTTSSGAGIPANAYRDPSGAAYTDPTGAYYLQP